MKRATKAARFLIRDRGIDRIRRLTRRDVAEHAAVAERRLERSLERLRSSERSLLAARMLLAASGISEARAIDASAASRSQLGQDLFALHCTGYRRNGFFVEFGAGDGEHLSNTVMLESDFGWTGILAEPLEEYHRQLKTGRSAALEFSCVWSRTGETIEFIEAGYLSTAERYRDADYHATARARGSTRRVETISLLDLLRRHGAPPVIDFLSIDTEGSELEILEAFPFGAEYEIDIIACEHNYAEQRSRIAELLKSNGYTRVAGSFSAHDDWFIRSASEAFERWRGA